MISKAQARQAFYKAAETIERNPELYEFHGIKVGEGDCPTCMWGHVGRAPGFDKDMNTVLEVPERFGFTHRDLTAGFPDNRDSALRWNIEPSHAAARLRAFADKHFPESEEKFQPCGQSFQELIDSLNGIAA